MSGMASEKSRRSSGMTANEENLVANMFMKRISGSKPQTTTDPVSNFTSACHNGDLKLVKKLSRSPGLLTATVLNTALLVAVEEGHVHMVKYLCQELKADVNQRRAKDRAAVYE